MNEIKRYDAHAHIDEEGKPYVLMNPDPLGRWVQWSDVQEAVEFYRNRKTEKSIHQILMEEERESLNQQGIDSFIQNQEKKTRENLELEYQRLRKQADQDLEDLNAGR